MGQYTDSILQFLRFALKVFPELRQQKLNMTSQNTCRAELRENAAAGAGPESSSEDRLKTPVLCSSFFSLHSGVELKSTLSFILSLYSLADILSVQRVAEGIREESEVRRLYGCLSGAVDPSRSISCTFADPSNVPSGQRPPVSHLLCLSDQCRLHLAVLPSFSLTAPKLKKYIQLYIDLNSYRHCLETSRTEQLQIWSESYLKRYQGITFMEFCAASESLLGIIAMYTAASNPRLSAIELKLLDEACFPWLCGLESLLRAYVRLKNSENSNELNFCSIYKTLKDCEQRICFFLEKAEEACAKLKDSSFYTSLIRILLGMYLSDPETSFGMFRLTSQNILKKSPRHTAFYVNGCRLLRYCRLPV